MADIYPVCSCTVCDTGLGFSFDGASSTLSSLPYSARPLSFELLAPRRGHTLVALNDSATLLTGGFDGTQHLSESWMLVPNDTKRPLRSCAPLPFARAGHSAVSWPHVNCVFVYGGTSEIYEQTSGSSLICYDVETDSWHNVSTVDAPEPEKRYLHAAACARGLMVVYGGLPAMSAPVTQRAPPESPSVDMEEEAEDWFGDLWVCALPMSKGMNAVWLRLDTSGLPVLRRPRATAYGENAVLIRGESDGAFATHLLVTLGPLSVRQACVREIANFRVHDVAFVRPNLLCSVGACGNLHRTQVIAVIPGKPAWLPPPPDLSASILEDIGTVCYGPFLCNGPFLVPRVLNHAQNIHTCNAINTEPVYVYSGTDPTELEHWLQLQWGKATSDFEKTHLDLVVQCGSGLAEDETYDGPAASDVIFTSAALLASVSEVIRRQINFDSHSRGHHQPLLLQLPETPATVFRLVREFVLCRRTLKKALWRLPVSRLIELWFFCAVYGLKELRDAVEAPLVHACRCDPALWGEINKVAEGHPDSALWCQPSSAVSPSVVAPICH